MGQISHPEEVLNLVAICDAGLADLLDHKAYLVVSVGFARASLSFGLDSSQLDLSQDCQLMAVSIATSDPVDVMEAVRARLVVVVDQAACLA